MEINFNIKLTESQQKAYRLYKDDTTRFLVLCWSRQSGKSTFCEIVLIENLCKKRRFSAYISPTYAQGRKVYKEICNLLEGTGLIKKCNSSTLTIESIYGSVIQFFSMESPTSIRGNTISGCLICDEMAFMPDVLPDGSEAWSSVIMPITKRYKPKTILISTPKGKRGDFYKMYLKAQKGQKGYSCITSDIYSDTLMTKEEIEDIRQQISPMAFEEEFMCKFLDSSLTYFTGFEECFEENYVFDLKQRIWCGIDLSANGKDETVVTFINEDNRCTQYHIKGTLDDKYSQIASILNQIVTLQAVYIENNSIGAPMINEIKKLVKRKSIIEEWTTTNESKNEMLSDLALQISKKNIHFDKNDTRLYADFGSFISKWSKTGKLQLMAMDGKHDDTIMSLGIALRCKQNRGKERVHMRIIST